MQTVLEGEGQLKEKINEVSFGRGHKDKKAFIKTIVFSSVIKAT